MNPRPARSKRIPESTDLPALARELAPLVARELAQMMTRASAPTSYSSRRGCGPTGIPAREWARIAREIGQKPYPAARWHVVERGVYERWLAGQSQPLAANSNERPAWDPLEALASVGIRPSRAFAEAGRA